MKKLHARELSRNQAILRFDIIPQHNWPSEQCLLHIRVFFGMKTKSPCFDLFIRWLIKQITNTYQNHFSRSYENRSNNNCTECVSFLTFKKLYDLLIIIIVPLGDVKRKVNHNISSGFLQECLKFFCFLPYICFKLIIIKGKGYYLNPRIKWNHNRYIVQFVSTPWLISWNSLGN